MKKHYIILLVIISSCLSLAAQTKLFPEQRIYLWDVTGSLLPDKPGGTDKYTSQQFRPVRGGNGLWNNLKDNLIHSIGAVEEDANSEIVIVPFYGKVLASKRFPATKAGKEDAINYVKNKKYESIPPTITNLSAPIEEAYKLAKSNWVNYIFVFTDGKDENDLRAYKKTLDSWDSKTQMLDRWTFGFYVLVDPIANNDTVRETEKKQKNFHIVHDAKQIIHLIQMPNNTLDYRFEPGNNQGPQDTIHLAGNYKGVKDGTLTLTSKNDYYDVISTPDPIYTGKLVYSLSVKPGVVTPPVDTIIELEAVMNGQDGYTFQTIKKSKVRVFNRKLNVMRIEPIKK